MPVIALPTSLSNQSCQQSEVLIIDDIQKDLEGNRQVSITPEGIW